MKMLPEAMLDSFFAGVPRGLEAPVSFDRESHCIDLWQGEATTCIGKDRVEGKLCVFLNLQPSPRIRWKFEFDEDGMQSLLRNFAVSSEKTAVLESTGPLGTFVGHILKSSTGELSGFFPAEGDEEIPAKVNRAVFLVVNGPPHDGTAIVRGTSSFLGRMSSTRKRINITVDRLSSKVSHDRAYSVTHVCELRWSGNIAKKEYSHLCRNLFRTLSLMATGWVGLAGPWYFHGDQLRYVSPKITKCSKPTHRSWAEDHEPGVFHEILEHLMSLSCSKDVDHQEAWQTAFHWFIEADQCAGGLEGALILQQAALEASAWYEVFARRKLCSEAGFSSLPAEDKLRWLCSLYSISIDLPQRAKNLKSLAKEMQRTDIIGVLTEVRNAYVHSSPKKLRKIRQMKTPLGLTELWYQVGGILELLVLASLGYSGKTLRRDVDGEYPNEILRPVPWQPTALN